MSHCSILETKVGNESLWKPEFMVLNQGYNGHYVKGYGNHNQVEMGHNTIKTSYNYKI